ncbi:MAG: PQQ-dependent sugar dehydrogenase [Acidimicrobiia bacterium]
MRRFAISSVLLLVLAAGCSNDQEVATTPPPATAQTSTTTTTTGVETTTSTTEPEATTTTLPPLQSLAYEEIADFNFPVQVIPAGEDGLIYVVDKVGFLWSVADGQVNEEPVLDITSLVSSSGEQGFLAATLHPEDATRLFVHYTDTAGDTVVAEYALVDTLTADPASATVLLEVDQPAGNHNGGMIQFDPQGRLLVGLGDGGGSNDAFGNGQNTDTLLGGIVAIDLSAGVPTLFNYGLRNPWRFWLDGDRIIIADVGQNAYEEVNVAPLQADLNFGWPITEGLHCFSPSSGCDTAGITMPVLEVAHGDGGSCSITGGVVYRGLLIPELEGHYLFSDYCGGYLRSFLPGAAEPEVVDWTGDVGVPGMVTGFGVDGDGEVYVTTTGSVLKLVAVR